MSANVVAPPSARRPSVFARLAGACHDRRRWVVGAWVLALVLIGAISGAAGNGFKDDFDLPASDSRTGFDVLDRDFGGQGTGVTGRIVFRSEQGVEDPAVKTAMEALFAQVGGLDNVERVVSPYGPEGSRLVSAAGPNAGKIAYAEIEMPEDIALPDAGTIRDAIIDAQPSIGGLQIELGGQIFSEFENPSSEVIGLAFAIVILILAFGSVLAMGLPVGVALFGIGIGTSLVIAVSNLVTLPETSQFIGLMIGLGVGIDYALLIVTRYREQLHAGQTVRQSVVVAMDTAGRSVLFAGTTVVISLLGMLVMGVGFVTGLAVGAAMVVAVTVAASLTLLPALLGFAGTNVERTRWRGLIAAGLAAIALLGIGLKFTPLALALPLAVIVLIAGLWVKPLKQEVRRRPQRPLRETFAYRWSRLIQHHPWRSAIGAALVLLILAAPVLSMRLGFSDESNYAEDTTTRKAYDLLVEGFGPGFNGPMLLVAELPTGYDPARLDAIDSAVRGDPGVAFLSPVILNDPSAPTSGFWNLIPTTGPQDEATTALVKRLRGDVLPPLEDSLGVGVNVTGQVPVSQDFSDYLEGRLTYFFVAVLALSFLLLMIVFRSLLVPLKAVIMNLLSIGAAYGIVVALFQWGWLSDITGVSPAPIEPWIPMMLFAITFGLSMDYEVFLLSRVREEWHRTGDARTSVADGLAATAKVITAAAAIMVVVFGSFLFENDRVLKLMGVGLASAILLDATIVRMLLVPATMELLGDKNWWLPRWLQRVLPTIDVEGTAPHTGGPEADKPDDRVLAGRS
jgi:RND superfamily putative drug exporter